MLKFCKYLKKTSYPFHDLRVSSNSVLVRMAVCSPVVIVSMVLM